MGFIGIYRDLSGMIGIWGEWGIGGYFMASRRDASPTTQIMSPSCRTVLGRVARIRCRHAAL